ncbi:MAG: antibiotic biosynthesis monooxygenase [Alphaproteobacteria bacterium]|nr:antibiotic biosynthesis monooxygenase [Alphaproteobacteria bacterium]MBN9566524.1 antibiotic biosynthesis monooxygenase [Alphaproteobacteria bacterium]
MFIAVYWWRVKPGKEDQFRRAWFRGTELIKARLGGLGSRLHHNSDGRFVAYAQWPDQATWQRAYDAHFDYGEPETARLFTDAVAEGAPGHMPVFSMTVTDDLLDLKRAA